MISTDNTIVVSYINKQGEPYSQFMRKGMEDPPMVPKHYIVVRIHHIPGKFNVLARYRLSTIVKTEWALDQSIRNSVSKCSTILIWMFVTCFSHRLPLYVFQLWTIKPLRLTHFS